MDIIKKLNDLMKENRLNQDKMIKEKLEEPAKITIIKEDQFKVSTQVEGNGFNVLFLLAKLENDILDKMDCTEEEFKEIKQFERMVR